jgi:hypothetical protein
VAKELASVGEQLIDLVGRAKADDLAALDASIAAKEKELTSLRAMRRVLALALGVETDMRGKVSRNGKAKHAAPPGPTSDLRTSEERRAACARYIATNGPTTGVALCRLFNIPQGSKGLVFDYEWFKSGDNGYELTPTGQAAANRLKAGGG